MDDIFVQLRDKLDDMATGYPATRSGVDLRILRHAAFSQVTAQTGREVINPDLVQAYIDIGKERGKL